METIQSIRKTTHVLFIIIALLGGFLLGMIFIKYHKPTASMPTPVATSASNFGNELITFLDNFSVNSDMGNPDIVAIYPEKKLLLISYPTSQETGSYGVIDYGKDIFYKNIGGFDYGISISPRAFLGNDKLLVLSYDGDIEPLKKILITNFKGETVKELYTLKSNEDVDYIHSRGDKISLVIKDSVANKTKTYTVDATTLTWSPIQ